ncbi:hypothetical protein OG497_37385 [Streptomyces sp. NBC_01242]|uniref:hypothetical protein n=1 Tax=Streptomyces sp. NBC_01242 TaxID=2903795 RepID=UPI0022517F0D|nr:hypothetical protein [Streptomyces sp. NBC_01242]MCX4799532.1 hypothetical protein [Streptomyces sp. NBC_01242]
MSDEHDPIIIEPYEDRRKADPSKNRFLLYDEDFEEETDPRYQLLDPTQKLYRPHFPFGEIAPWVFGRNTTWLRNQFKRGVPELNGKPLDFRQIKRRAGLPERRLTLPDIERLAWALYERGSTWPGAFDAMGLQRATQILAAVAHQYGALVGEDGKKVS